MTHTCTKGQRSLGLKVRVETDECIISHMANMVGN